MIRTGAQYRDSIRDGRAGLYRRRAREGRDDPSDVQAAGRHPRPLLRHAARGRDARSHELCRGWRDPRRRQQAALHPGRLVAEAPRDRHVAGRSRRRRHPGRRRDRGRDVVAVRRPGRARRGRPAILQEHPQPRPQGPAHRSVPCLGQHRSQGRPLQAAAGAGPRHAAACREGDRRRHRRARRQVRDGGGLCQPGLHQADHRQLGQQRAVGLCRGFHLRFRLTQPQVHLPHRLRRPRARRTTIRWPTASTRSIRWSSSTMC